MQVLLFGNTLHACYRRGSPPDNLPDNLLGNPLDNLQVSPVLFQHLSHPVNQVHFQQVFLLSNRLECLVLSLLPNLVANLLSNLRPNLQGHRLDSHPDSPPSFHLQCRLVNQ